VSGPVSSLSGRAATRAALGAVALVALCALVLAPAASARRAPAASTAAPAIAFIKDDHVWTVSPDGSGSRQLTVGKVSDRVPVWSPDHATVAFVRPGTHFRTSSIYTVPAAGGQARLLYKDRNARTGYLLVTGLAYSPDGAKLAFADVYRTRKEWPVVTRLVILDIASGRTSVMLKKTGGFGHAIVIAWRLAWSPDGSAILISQEGQEEGGGTWMYTIISGATKAIPVPEASTADWAADGQSVLLSVSTWEKTTIEQTKLDGTVIRTLATGGGWWDSDGVYTAHYSPDGAQVVYVTSDALWIMGADGTGKHEVTAGTDPGW
jgi:Tol biopolymer transport system component